MTCFISGGAKSGKSSLAQALAVSLAKNKKLYYVATMISTGAEDNERIRRHIADREGMGFETLECFTHIMNCLKTANPCGVFLVDSVTALIQNALFPMDKNYEMDLTAAESCIKELVDFARSADDVIFVSDFIYADGMKYPESTENYRWILGDAGRRLASVCDTVVEVSAGQYTIFKGELNL